MTDCFINIPICTNFWYLAADTKHTHRCIQVHGNTHKHAIIYLCKVHNSHTFMQHMHSTYTHSLQQHLCTYIQAFTDATWTHAYITQAHKYSLMQHICIYTYAHLCNVCIELKPMLSDAKYIHAHASIYCCKYIYTAQTHMLIDAVHMHTHMQIFVQHMQT